MTTRPLLFALALVLGLPGHVGAREGGDEVTAEERDAAIESGLAWCQEALWRLPEVQGTPRKPFDVAAVGYVTLLAERTRGLRTEDRGTTLRKVKRYLLEYLDEVETRSRQSSQLPARHGMAVSNALIQYTWPLAMAALFFHEAHDQGRMRRESEDALRRIGAVLAEAQDENGGWGHGRTSAVDGGSGLPPELEDKIPEEMKDMLRRSGASGGYPSTLLASSILVAGALGSAQELLGDASACLEAAPAYFRTAALPNGNFPYDPSQRSAGRDRTGAGRAAGAIWALRQLGIPDGDAVVRKASTYVDDHLSDVAEGHGSATLNLLYGALAQSSRGGDAWAALREAFFRRIVDAQDDDGRHTCICEGKVFGSTNDSEPFGQLQGAPALLQAGADVYVTALHTWILLLDRNGPEDRPGTPGAVTPR